MAGALFVAGARSGGNQLATIGLRSVLPCSRCKSSILSQPTRASGLKFASCDKILRPLENLVGVDQSFTMVKTFECVAQLVEQRTFNP